MSVVGTATLDFGTMANIPTSGNASISLDITGQAAILATSRVEAWLRLEATTEHPIDDLRFDPIDVTAGNIVAGTGFTIYGKMPFGNAYGTYKVDWVWV
jgi:hypothetical protein